MRRSKLIVSLFNLSLCLIYDFMLPDIFAADGDFAQLQNPKGTMVARIVVAPVSIRVLLMHAYPLSNSHVTFLCRLD